MLQLRPVRKLRVLLVQQLDALQHRQRRMQTTSRVLPDTVAQRKAEDDHQPVADELVQKPAM